MRVQAKYCTYSWQMIKRVKLFMRPSLRASRCFTLAGTLCIRSSYQIQNQLFISSYFLVHYLPTKKHVPSNTFQSFFRHPSGILKGSVQLIS